MKCTINNAYQLFYFGVRQRASAKVRVPRVRHILTRIFVTYLNIGEWYPRLANNIILRRHAVS